MDDLLSDEYPNENGKANFRKRFGSSCGLSLIQYQTSNQEGPLLIKLGVSELGNNITAFSLFVRGKSPGSKHLNL